jgi:hypothetical protein
MNECAGGGGGQGQDINPNLDRSFTELLRSRRGRGRSENFANCSFAERGGNRAQS